MENESKRSGSSLRQLRRLLGEARPYAGRLAVAGVCLCVAGAIGLVYPFYFGQVIDAAFTEKDLPSLDASAIFLVALFAVQGVFAFLRQYLLMWVGERTVANLRVKIFRHFVTLPQAYFLRTRTGELLSRLSDDVGRLQMVVSVDLSVALRATISLVGAVTIVLATNPKLAALMLAVVPPLAIFTRVWGRSIRRLSRRAQDALARAAGGLQESVAAMETVQAFTREEHETARYGADIEASFDLFARRALVRALYFSISGFVAFAGIAAIFWLGGRMVAAGEIGPGDLTQFLLYTMMIGTAVASFAGLVGSLATAVGSTTRVYEILDEEPDIADPPGATPLEVRAGRVAFEGVSFSYPGRPEKVLDDVSFAI
jgi:ABC-type multidrug transport system fused ATPase/permease subunit